MNLRNEITFEIVERLSIIQTYPTGWNRELSIGQIMEFPRELDRTLVYGRQE